MTEMEILENELNALMDQMNAMGGENPDYEKVRKNYQELIKTYINLRKLESEEKYKDQEVKNQMAKDELERQKFNFEKAKYEDEKEEKANRKYIAGISLDKWFDTGVNIGLIYSILHYEQLNIISTKAYSLLKGVKSLI